MTQKSISVEHTAIGEQASSKLVARKKKGRKNEGAYIKEKKAKSDKDKKSEKGTIVFDTEGQTHQPRRATCKHEEAEGILGAQMSCQDEQTRTLEEVSAKRVGRQKKGRKRKTQI
jgi:hypothetical protein